MIQYYINMCLCSGVFILFYLLLLEKEKFHFFNRYYLLGSLLCSILIPLITWEVSAPVVENSAYAPIFEKFTVIQFSEAPASPDPSIQATNSLKKIEIAGLVYLAVTLLLFCWFLIRFNNILSKVQQFGFLEYQGSFLVLTETPHEPFSFLSYIFINRNSFENQQVSDEIIHHELAHTQQKHTFDVLLLEIFHAVFWLNPFLYLYRRAVMTNHEFLADQSVINTFHDVKNYQRILLNAISSGQTSSLSNRLTGSKQFNITKKRLIKMTKQKSMKNSIIKISLIIPLSILIIYFFSNKTLAQSPTEEPREVSLVQQKENTCPEYAKVYCSVLTKYDLKGVEPKDFSRVVNAEDQEKMIEIFKKLSPAQQETQIIGFSLIGGPLKKRIPTTEQLESWKDEKEYGVWLDGKRIKNSELNNYSNTDFSHYGVSRLTRTAYNYGKHVYQLNLETNASFEEYNLKNTKKRYHIFYRRPSID
ncbi:MAG: M56 family metallopeptidase [Bacteroidota bacterium]